MRKIIVVRHAESVANTQGIYQGQTYDTGLSPLGKKQAKALAAKLAKEKIDRILTSPLKRTWETAKEISRVLKKEAEIEKNLIETNHGKWEGKSKEWIRRYYRNVLETWENTPSKAVFPKGERFTQTVDRIKKFLHDYEWTGTNLLVTHDNIIRIMICLSKNISIDNMWGFDLEPAAINIFTIEGVDGSKKITFKLSDAKHLEGLRGNIMVHAL